ncbi:MAG: YgiT-type zinc finger protein [Clostridia bacterium]|nr:YgiT-type zinc finger protein [Clostridia bacterium]
MNLIKCLFCGKVTKIHKINVQKTINSKTVTLANAPVYYCEVCKETFYPKEVQDSFRYIKDRGLETKGILYNFDDMSKKVSD